MNATKRLFVVAMLLAMFSGCCCYDRGWNAPYQRPWCPADWCWGDQCSTENRIPSITPPNAPMPSNIPMP